MKIKYKIAYTIVGILFVFFIGSIVCVSCCENVHYKVRAQYEVCWPDTTITYDSIFNCVYDPFGRGDNFEVTSRIESYKGSNYIRIDPGWNAHMRTTAPIRLHKCELIK